MNQRHGQSLPAPAVKFLLDYAKNDWVGFFAITSALQKFYPEATGMAKRQAAIQLIGDAWDYGLRPGDLTGTKPVAFAPWALSKQAAFQKIKQSLDTFGDIPSSDSDNICWFDVAE